MKTKATTKTINVTMNPAVYSVSPRRFFAVVLAAYFRGLGDSALVWNIPRDSALVWNIPTVENAVQYAEESTRRQFGKMDIFNPPMSVAETGIWTCPNKKKKR